MNKTKIEWVKNPDGTQGYTSNPVRGKCPVDCNYCYVKPFRNRYGWHKDIRFYPQELVSIEARRKPCGIFLGSTIELFHYKTIIYMSEIMETIRACPQHRFYLLTKQPQNLPKFSPFPENCYVGGTVTNLDMLKFTLTALAKVRASKKFLSFEPLLGRMREDNFGGFGQRVFIEALTWYDKIDWLIIGACTGTLNDIKIPAMNYPELALLPYGKKWTLQPCIEWIREIVEAADRAGTPVFLKDNLCPLLGLGNGKSICHNNGNGTLRQEFPKLSSKD